MSSPTGRTGGATPADLDRARRPGVPAPDDAARVGRRMEALARAAAAGLPGSPERCEALPAPLPSAPAPAPAPELGRRLVALEADGRQEDEDQSRDPRSRSRGVGEDVSPQYGGNSSHRDLAHSAPVLPHPITWVRGPPKGREPALPQGASPYFG
ncbi:hypothetical protein GTY49_28800 [Streptomyces sp. SID5477]|nr:hypothetical protein [Streptomyces sp. SID5477]